MLTSFMLNGVEFKISVSEQLIQALEEKVKSSIEPNFDKIPSCDFDTYEDGCHITRRGNSINVELVDFAF